jgi:hypothetical protein
MQYRFDQSKRKKLQSQQAIVKAWSSPILFFLIPGRHVFRYDTTNVQAVRFLRNPVRVHSLFRDIRQIHPGERNAQPSKCFLVG